MGAQVIEVGIRSGNAPLRRLQLFLGLLIPTFRLPHRLGVPLGQRGELRIAVRQHFPQFGESFVARCEGFTRGADLRIAIEQRLVVFILKRGQLRIALGQPLPYFRKSFVPQCERFARGAKLRIVISR